MAMALMGKSRHYHFHAIQRRHINSTARKVGYVETAEPLMREIIERTPAVVEQVRGELPEGFSNVVADKVLGGLLAAARALEMGVAG
jgi:serine/threonine-protein kinase HipA